MTGPDARRRVDHIPFRPTGGVLEPSKFRLSNPAGLRFRGSRGPGWWPHGGRPRWLSGPEHATRFPSGARHSTGRRGEWPAPRGSNRPTATYTTAWVRGQRPFRHLGYEFEGGNFPGSGSFRNLDELHGSKLFEQSKTQYAPGYEKNSVLADPQVRSIGGDGRFRETDDLRLGDTTPARAAGIDLPNELKELDPGSPANGPDIGCYPGDAEPLRVGVEGRRSFPPEP